ncbi:type I phosphodiesterase/nucleotide pyrophosphatase [Salinarchaeum sp. Harcht-Bsk1]|uniref:alkaline phosphatase family protein n=1 Tax=Salinarchaeum sp. Harcht-Bsk1 TaxID=1333523 RepID=UPI0003422B8D|nr:alkaline phosphatase family protein [Salinarchaeum sp. Harcht-Bsk1]AGN00930.1 type I phosphodiesterase/nucleotide pyrophosphatase [Salinarchaeum sp. Harcht-Bsk1]
MTKTIVVGLDGASWDLLDPWIEAGHLPTIERLREEGSWATNRSCYPPVTFPNWKVYASGKNPGQFGVFWFERVDLANGTIDVMEGADFDTAELWDYLNDEGHSTGVVNMPSTYPPREVDGVMIAGGPDAVEGEYRSIDSGYTYPPELAEELHERFDYDVHPDPLLSSNEETGAEVDEILRLLDLRFDVAIDALQERDLDFVHVTLFYLNVIHHFFWDAEPSLRAWQLVDERLAEIDAMEGVNLVITSDHGSMETEAEFYINEWLAENGYLTKARSAEYYFQRLGLTRERALALAKRAGAVDLLAKVVPERIQRMVPQEAGAKRGRKLEAIDLAETAAVASSQGPIYLNPDVATEETREQLIEDLRAVTDDQGEPYFPAVYRGEEVYSGEYVEDGPDVVVEQRPGIHVNDGLGGGEVVTEPDRWAAENTMTGIFLATGPDFEPRGHMDEIDMVDVAPTLLATYDVAIPTDVDGEVLDIFSEPRDPGTREPIDLDDDRGSEAGDVEDRLKQLGYME